VELSDSHAFYFVDFQRDLPEISYQYEIPDSRTKNEWYFPAHPC
jgi:hypothetical protein